MAWSALSEGAKSLFPCLGSTEQTLYLFLLLPMAGQSLLTIDNIIVCPTALLCQVVPSCPRGLCLWMWGIFIPGTGSKGAGPCVHPSVPRQDQLNLTSVRLTAFMYSFHVSEMTWSFGPAGIVKLRSAWRKWFQFRIYNCTGFESFPVVAVATVKSCLIAFVVWKPANSGDHEI